MTDIHLSETMMASLSIEQQDSLKNLFWNKLTEVYKLSKEELITEVELLESDPEKLKVIIGEIKINTDSIN